MLKLSKTMRNAALATVLGAGLIGSTAVTFAPAPANAQVYRDSDDRYYRDRDDRVVVHRDWDDRYYHRDWDDRAWFGIGVPGFGIGFYDTPTYYHYYYSGPYCSSYDYDHGYCTY